MKKILCVVLLSFILLSCSGNKESEKKEVENSTGLVEKPDTVSYEWVNISKKESVIDKSRSEINLTDLSLLYSRIDIDTDNNLMKMWDKFVSKLNKKNAKPISKYVDGGITYTDFEQEVKNVPKELKRNINLELTITDKSTNKPIKTGTIFVNNIKMGTFTNGTFKKEFLWPKWIELFHVVVRNAEYGDAFVTLNSLNLKWSLVIGDIRMKKAVVLKKVDLAEKTSLEAPKFKANFKKCSFVDNAKNCPKEKVDVKINFISGKAANNRETSLNMTALTKEWNVVELISGWMAFVDVITNDGEILNIQDGNTIDISFNLTDEDIENMKNRDSGNWIYSKEKWLWLETDDKNILDEKNKVWKATIR